MRYLIVALIILNLISFKQSFAQGCSDAGFCSIGTLKPLSSDTIGLKKQTLSLLLTNGVGDEGTNVFTPAIQYDNRISEKWEVQAKLTANYASGNLGDAVGLGDVFLSATYTMPAKSKWSKSFTLGTKVFLNNSNLLSQSKPLPMVYQSSLGTIDVLAGYTMTNYRWLFSAGIQLPLTGENSNAFLPEAYNSTDADKYPPSDSLNRKADALLRIGYNIIAKEKWKLNAGLLGIYHLQNDTYRDFSLSTDPIEIDGSQGLTLNATFALRYLMNDKFSFGLSGGFPLVVRDVRPDGLTRSIVITPEINFNF
jgi:hypothetical protein